jgi:hypothetical protein
MVKLVVALYCFLIVSCGANVGTNSGAVEAVVENAESPKTVALEKGPDIIIAGAEIETTRKIEVKDNASDMKAEEPAEAPAGFLPDSPIADIKPERKALERVNCSERYSHYTISVTVTDFDDDSRDVIASYQYDLNVQAAPPVFDLPDNVFKATFQKERDAAGNVLPTVFRVAVSPEHVSAVAASKFNATMKFNPNYPYFADYRIGRSLKSAPGGIEFYTLGKGDFLSPTHSYNRKCSYETFPS